MAPQLDEREYLEAQNVEASIASAIAAVLKERPANALARIAELIAPAPIARDSLLETIGNTPMIKLGRMLPAGAKATVLVKMEMQNPGGSIKDRIAKHMIEEAERTGKLKPGMTVVEGTSGNTGIGVAMVCAAKGYKCIIVMPQVPPMLERYMVCRQFGADVHLTAAALGAKGLVQHYDALVASDPSTYFGTNQFWNEANPEAHVQTTGPEVWAQTNGSVDVFIHGVGTGGTIKGAGSYLKEKKPSVQASRAPTRLCASRDAPCGREGAHLTAAPCGGRRAPSRAPRVAGRGDRAEQRARARRHGARASLDRRHRRRIRHPLLRPRGGRRLEAAALGHSDPRRDR